LHLGDLPWSDARALFVEDELQLQREDLGVLIEDLKKSLRLTSLKIY